MSASCPPDRWIGPLSKNKSGEHANRMHVIASSVIPGGAPIGSINRTNQNYNGGRNPFRFYNVSANSLFEFITSIYCINPNLKLCKSRFGRSIRKPSFSLLKKHLARLISGKSRYTFAKKCRSCQRSRSISTMISTRSPRN